MKVSKHDFDCFIQLCESVFRSNDDGLRCYTSTRMKDNATVEQHFYSVDRDFRFACVSRVTGRNVYHVYPDVIVRYLSQSKSAQD